MGHVVVLLSDSMLPKPQAGEGYPTGSLTQGRSTSSLHDSAYNNHSGHHNGYNSAAAV